MQPFFFYAGKSGTLLMMKKSTYSYFAQLQTLVVVVLAFVYEFWLLHPVQFATTRVFTNINNQQLLAIWFVIAVVVAVLFAFKLPVAYRGRVFVSVVAGAGVLVASWYTLLHVIPQTFASISAVLITITALIAYFRVRIVLVQNTIIFVACVGLARTFGLQFAPQSVALIVGLLAAYALFSRSSFAKSGIPAAPALGLHEPVRMDIPEDLHDWLQAPTTERKSEHIGAVDLLLPLSLAVSYGAYQASQSFSLVAAATIIGFSVIFRLRAYMQTVPVLSILVGICLVALYFGK